MTGRIVTAEEAKTLREASSGPWVRSDAKCEEPGDEGWWIGTQKVSSEHHAVAVTFALNPRDEADSFLIAVAPDLAFTVEQQGAELAQLKHGLGLLQGLCASLIRTLDSVPLADPEQKAAQAEAMENTHRLARMLGVEA